MHFRPRDYCGVLDADTCAILYALNEKYRGL
jgi:N-acetylmuramoyl-L-alanine amidase